MQSGDLCYLPSKAKSRCFVVQPGLLVVGPLEKFGLFGFIFGLFNFILIRLLKHHLFIIFATVSPITDGFLEMVIPHSFKISTFSKALSP